MTRPELPTIFIEIETPRCPVASCSSRRLDTYKTLPQGDGSRLRYCQCLDCGQRFKLVIEEKNPDEMGIPVDLTSGHRR